MSKYFHHLLGFTLCFVFSGCNDQVDTNNQNELFKIAFGSCGHETHPLPIFDEVVKHKPDVFAFLGDNLYGDTKDMDELRGKYDLLESKPTFQNLKNNVPIIATWDDHDYGWNDAGRHYEFKEESKDIFLDFFDEPEDSERRKHKGIYHSYMYDLGENKVQIIMLDMRTFRDDLKLYNGEKDDDNRYFYNLDYIPYAKSDSTLLGAEQWSWLNSELQKDADVRVIGTSTQFGIEYNGYEAWANFPHEQEKMLSMIKRNRAAGVLFISGDVHYAEISKMVVPDIYPLYDVTSSGLSSTWHFATPNKNRIEGPIMDNHFGMLSISFEDETPNVKAEVWDIHGNQRVEYKILLEQLQF